MAKKNLKLSDIDDGLSFGRYLRTARSEKGLLLEDIAQEIRVSEKTLRYLEDESHEKLPDEVFVRGFVRAYAHIVDINADEAVQRYLASRHRYLQSLQFEKHFLKAGKTFWPRLLMIISTMAGIMLLSVLAFHQFNEPPANQKEESSTHEAPGATTPGEAQAKHSQMIASTAQKSQSNLLRIRTVEPTWLKIIIDRQHPKEYSLSPGDRLELKATSEFNLLVGNATGIELELDNKPIPIEGKRGQVVSLKIP